MKKYTNNFLLLAIAHFLPTLMVAQANTKYGTYALSNNTTGFENSAFGYESLRYNTTGYQNAAVGIRTLRNNTDGNRNVAIGHDALMDNTTGSANIAIGTNALPNNTTGSTNIGIGGFALLQNTTGQGNVAVGSNALWYNQTGNYNTAVGVGSLAGAYTQNAASENCSFGYWSLFSNTAYYNNAFGSLSLAANKTGTGNCAFGNSSLNQNSVGGFNSAFGNNSLQNNKANFNSAFGHSAALKTTSGTGNSAMGYVALNNNATGSNNTAMGYFSLFYTKNSENVGLGAFAGLDSDNSTACTYLGYASNNDIFQAAYTNSAALGYNSRITASNQVSVGNSSTTSIGGFSNWTNFSDARYKKEVKDNVPGLAFINQLRPVTYRIDVDGLARHLNEDELKDRETGKTISHVNEAIQKARTEKSTEIETGFIAQEVEAAAKALGYDFSGVDKPKNDADLYGLRYASFTVPLVKAVQELDEENKTIKLEYAALKTQYDLLLRRIEALESAGKDRSANKEEIQSSLQQNIPNPFSDITTIDAIIKPLTKHAVLIITDEKGRFVKEIAVSGTGRVTLSLNADDMPAGVYFYALYQDGLKVDAKKMLRVN